MESSKTYRRDEWAGLAEADPSAVPDLETREVLLPLAEWLRRRRCVEPFVIGVCGSVAVGKSTFCQSLREVLNGSLGRVEVVSTDSFLLPNRELEARGIMHRKGFPESYDPDRFERFFSAIRRHEPAEVPVYSHEVYDVTPLSQRVDGAPVVVVEGVAAMRRTDALDVSIYLDADETHIESWFLQRVLALRDEAKPETFYWHFRDIPRDEFMELARRVWHEVNLVNLHQHILPLRDVADVVLRKELDHRISHVTVRQG